MFRQTIQVLAVFLGAWLSFCADVSVAGTWEGRDNDLPAVELILRNNNGQISGTIAFYFQARWPDGKWHSDAQSLTLPLLSPKLHGAILTFKTIHHQTHESPEMTNTYRVKFVEPKEARLQVFRNGAKEDDSVPGVKLARCK